MSPNFVFNIINMLGVLKCLTNYEKRHAFDGYFSQLSISLVYIFVFIFVDTTDYII